MKERCKLDIYYPEDTTGCPVVVWFHGGGLTQGNKSFPWKLKEKGMVLVAVNYRLLPKVEINECLDDAAAAVAWVFREIGKYGGDKRKIFVSGHSAGGYLTAMIGLDKIDYRRPQHRAFRTIRRERLHVADDETDRTCRNLPLRDRRTRARLYGRTGLPHLRATHPENFRATGE